LRTLIGYLAALLLCLACLTWLTRLWKLDLAVPFNYSRDALAVQLFVHSVHETGWYLHNDRVGMPESCDMHDYPMCEGMHFFWIKGLSYLTGNPFVTSNLYFLLTFPLTTVLALFVFRRFGCSFASALVGSLLFTFLPYHVLRGTGHLFLASYYHVPLAVMLLLWIYRGESLWQSRRRTIGTLLICLAIGSGGIYYAFFTGVLLSAIGVTAGFRLRSPRPIISAAALLALIVVTGLINLTPYFVQRARHGPNPAAAARHPAEAEIYGLRIPQLLLPATRHSLTWLAKLKEEYNRHALLVNENDAATLGVVASAGFLMLLGNLLRIRRAQLAQNGQLWVGLTFLNLFALLLALRGGFGGLFALWFPWIRGYNRISILLGFFALFAVVLGLDALRQRFTRSPASRYVFHGFLILLTAAGLMDQTPRGSITPAERIRPVFEHDAAFVRRIEAATPAGSMIFQLPYAVFPEQGALHAMGDYEHLRAHVHSRSLRWSYGAMRGRAGDAWQRKVAGLPPREMIYALAEAGFAGIYLDRFGYEDQASELESELRRLLPVAPLVSPNGRLVYFRLEDSRRAAPRLSWRAASSAAVAPGLHGPPGRESAPAVGGSSGR
jgi:phosphoglycerol transferase